MFKLRNRRSLDRTTKSICRAWPRLGFETLEDRTVPSTLDYATFLGGNLTDGAFAVAVDPGGNTYVTGSTASANFPATLGAFDGSLNGIYDAFVAKFRPDGTLAWATYLGGDGDERGHGIAIDAANSVYVTGRTDSANFPTTVGSLDTTRSGNVDAFVTKLNANGTTLDYSTFLGGAGDEIDQGFDKLARRVGGIAVDSAGQAYVTGSTTSADFPTTPGAFDTAGPGFIDAFVSKLNAAGTALIYSTYLGGDDIERAHDIAIDSAGNAYVTGNAWSVNFPTTAGAFQPNLAGGGSDNFVTKLNVAGSALVYSSYLGGTGGEVPGRLAVDSTGQAYVTGSTTSFDFPTTAGAFQPSKATNGSDAFVSKVNASGTAIVYSTHLGGTFGNDFAEDIAVDGSGNVGVTGFTESGTFPVVDAIQPNRSGVNDAFVTLMNSSGTALLTSSYLGGGNGIGSESGYGIAVDGSDVVRVVGSTNSAGFPTTASAFQSTFGGVNDAFVIRITTGTVPSPQVTAVAINGGAAQRSRVTSLAVTFNAVVTFAGAPASAFTLTRDGGGAVLFSATSSNAGDVTVVTLNSLTGPETEFGSMRDGRYTLTAIASQISTNGQQMASNFTFGDAQGLFRYYGDMTGDRRVDISDFGFFSQAFLQAPNYNAALDFNADGRIDIADFGHFSVRFFTNLP